MKIGVRTHGRGGTRTYRRDGGQPVQVVVSLGRGEPHGGVGFERNMTDQRAVGKVAVGGDKSAVPRSAE